MADKDSSEFHLQAQCVAHFRFFHSEYANLLVYCDNNASNPVKGKMKKALGTVRGWPDLFLYVQAGGYAGLAIEMKAKGKKPTPVQRDIHAQLARQGYKVAVVDSFTSFRELIESYLPKKT